MKRILTTCLTVAQMTLAAAFIWSGAAPMTPAYAASAKVLNEDAALVNRVQRVSATVSVKLQREAARLDRLAQREALSSLTSLTGILAIDARGSDRDVIAKIVRLAALVDRRIQADGAYLTRRQLMDSLDQLQGLARLVNDGSTPTPPTPQPPLPPPPRPPAPPSYGVNVRGAIENLSFEFQGASLEEIFEQCESYYAANVRGTSVDDITVSVNYGSARALRNGASYWKTASDVCGQIVKATMSATRIPVSTRYNYIVTGSVETLGYKFKGRNRAELNDACERFYASHVRGASVDDITVTVNFGNELVRRNGSSYWRTSFDVCQQIISAVN